MSTWKRQAIEGMAGVFSDQIKKAENKDGEIKDLLAKIAQLAVESDFFVTRAKVMNPSERREMVRNENTDLSLTRQCKLLKISRSSIYYTPVGMNAKTLKLMLENDSCSQNVSSWEAARSQPICLSQGSLQVGIVFVA